jgi:hypothetical protein
VGEAEHRRHVGEFRGHRGGGHGGIFVLWPNRRPSMAMLRRG